MSTSNPLILYKSSAGSGKTYTLTMEYLKLALEFPTAFRHILAVTFTNKATQEMKERILRELGRIKKQANPAEKMDQCLLTHLNITPEILQQRAGATLSAILHDYSAFSVSTIDSFFQRIIRAFAREIDLQAKFDIELDQDAVLDRLVDRLIIQLTKDEFLHRWLVAFALEQIQMGKSWDIRRNIKKLGEELFKEEFKRHSVEIKRFLKDKEHIHLLRDYLFQQRNMLVQQGLEMKTLANEIREAHALSWEDFKGAGSSFAKKFDLLGAPLNPFPDLSPTQKSLSENVEGWFTKTSKKRDAIESAYAAGLGQLWGRFLPLKTQWKTLEAIRKNFPVFGVFRHLLEELEALKQEENIVLISDANDFLKEITADIDAPFIYEKVGNKFQNYLIDEFQDTSGFQWASFRPLLVNTLSQGHTNLLVGDVKQSIYRWRGGEMRLLLDQVEASLGHYGVDIHHLVTNFRSLPVIVAFNNALFQSLPDHLSTVLHDKYGIRDGGLLHQAYADVMQEVAPAKERAAFKGKVRLEFLGIDQNEDAESTIKELQTARIPHMVMELQDNGFRPRDIAFLVRTKKEGLLIADTLVNCGLEYAESSYSFDVISDEAMLVSKSTAVKCLVACLRFLADTSDEVSLRTMWYHWAVFFDHPVSHELFHAATLPEPAQAAFEKFHARIDIFLQLPLLELIDDMVDTLGFDRKGAERAYLSAFKEGIYDYVSKNRADLSGFLDWWSNHQAKLTVKIPEEHDAMRILTIHKSKGLQFKVVLMPFLNWAIVDTKNDNILWTPFTLQDPQLEAVIPLTMSKSLEDSSFSTIYQQEVTMNFLDTLNMVYVASTRAEEVFWGLSPDFAPTSTTTFTSFAGNLQQVLRTATGGGGFSFQDYYDEEAKVFDAGDWPTTNGPIPGSQVPTPLRWEHTSWTNLLTVKAYPGDLSEAGIERRRQGDLGTVVHRLLEVSKSEQDMMLGLEAVYFEGVLDGTEKEHIRSAIAKLFLVEKFRSWFEGEGIVLTEQGIILPGGSHKRPDRIILYKENAEVIDFKTGVAKERDYDQIRGYMGLVKKLVSLPVSGYLCYLDTAEIIEVSL
nr:AAA family ATPase [Cytophagales bacterium]